LECEQILREVVPCEMPRLIAKIEIETRLFRKTAHKVVKVFLSRGLIELKEVGNEKLIVIKNPALMSNLVLFDKESKPSKNR
jgi:hypothetical protein